MINAIKVDLVKLVEKIEGLPKQQRADIIELLKDPDTVIPVDQKVEISIFLTMLFCQNDPKKMLTDYNKKLLEEYSSKHLTPTKQETRSHSRKK